MIEYEFPEELYFTREHEWVRKEGASEVVVGISDYGQESMGDIVFVELPEVGDEVVLGESLGLVESAGSVFDLYSPVSGRVIEINNEILDKPEDINKDPYGDGWLIRMEMDKSQELDELMDSMEYEKYVREEEREEEEIEDIGLEEEDDE